MVSPEVTFKTLKAQIFDQKGTGIFDGYKEGVVRFTTEAGDLKHSKTLLIINGIYKATLPNPENVIWEGENNTATLTVLYKDPATQDDIAVVVHYSKNAAEDFVLNKPLYIVVSIAGVTKPKRTFTLSEFV